jgi:hypothetical protein
MKSGNGDAQALYELILATANRFLRNAKMFEISILQDHNPTYEELANIMHRLAKLVYDMVDDVDPMMAHKAAEYVQIMTDMAIAITADDDVKLQSLITELDNKPFI